MRRVIGFALGLASTMAYADMVFAQDAARFDGNWNVVLACPDSPDGARAFTFRFGATVSGGKLHAQFGQLGASPSLTLDGPIQRSGDAILQAKGITGAASLQRQPDGSRRALSSARDGPVR